MRILLVRHGEPDMKEYTSGKDGTYGEWLKKYNASGIRQEMRPPEELLKLIEDVDVLISSDLKRALDSARLLAGNKVIMQNPIFREFELPENKKKYPKFSPEIWSTIFRILWFTGYSNKSENFTDAKIRIKDSAEKLEDLAIKHSEIVLVGHGLMNRFIGMELKKQGWKKRRNGGKGYWCYFEYTKPAPEIPAEDKEYLKTNQKTEARSQKRPKIRKTKPDKVNSYL